LYELPPALHLQVPATLERWQAAARLQAVIATAAMHKAQCNG